MRDFRDSKAMAHTLRAALATKGLKITVGQSLELTAEMFGLPGWNTLAAAIRRSVSDQKSETASRPKGARMWSGPPDLPTSWRRRSIGRSHMPESGSMNSRRWSISYLRCSMTPMHRP
ncbi:glyoxalase superfamily protein [Bradyrhizobium sp. USDA 4461]